MDFLEIFGWGKKQLNDIQYVGYSYLKQGKYDIAIKFFNALNILKPKNSYYLQILGALYLEKNDNVKALKFINEALKITPHNQLILFNKSKILINIGYKKQAFDILKKLQNSKNEMIKNQAAALLLANR